MVLLILLFQTAQNGDGILNGRFGNQHGLETPGKRRVLLDIFAVLVKGCCTNGTQLTTGKCGFQNVARIHGTLGGTGAHNGMQLINEEDNTTVGLADFLYDALETVLKFAAIFCARHQRGHVKFNELLVAQC